MRILWIAFFALFFASRSFLTPSSAATIDIALFPSGSVSSGNIAVNNGYGMYGVGAGYLTAFFAANPGDTVNFGTVQFPLIETGDQYSDVGIAKGYTTAYFSPLPNNGVMPTMPLTFVFSCNTHFSQMCQPTIDAEVAAYVPTDTELSFVIPEGATGVQLLFNTAAFEYFAPAVPEPSTWAMLLLGFASLGFITHRCRWMQILD